MLVRYTYAVSGLTLKIRYITGQDIMTHERSREDYIREATQYLNSCDKVLSEEGGDQSMKELLMLTKGVSSFVRSYSFPYAS
jgi:hypothetical protein